MSRPLIMGVVNVTQDSFSDGGKFSQIPAAIDHAMKLLEEGADIIDIGGESTRPGADAINPRDEMDRVIPVISELAKHAKFLSIDTRHSLTMQAAVEAGANFINDVSALQGQGSLDVAARANVPICLMHMKGTPENMQVNPEYSDVVAEVMKFLNERIEACLAAGISRDKIYVDVGIGFGKTLNHNLDLFRNLGAFHTLGVKLLLGASRKKFIDAIAGPAAPDERMGGSIAAALWGYSQGAHIIRVHDVKETRQAFDVWESFRPAHPIPGQTRY